MKRFIVTSFFGDVAQQRPRHVFVYACQKVTFSSADILVVEVARVEIRYVCDIETKYLKLLFILLEKKWSTLLQ